MAKYRRRLVGGCGALLALFAGAASALTFMDIDYVCPVGGERFRQSTMSSGTSFWQHLDGQLEGAIASPTPLVICPGNGLVLYKPQFSESEIARLTPLVHSEAYQWARKQHSSYGLLNVLLEYMGEPLSDRAPVLQQAVWERPQQYLPLAEQAYAARCPDEATVQDADWMQCQMLRGEWERRLSRFERAGQRFERLAPLMDKVFEGDEPRRERFRRIIAQQRNLVAARSPFSARIEQEQRSTSRVPSRPVVQRGK